jgi:hypothetical protein
VADELPEVLGDDPGPCAAGEVVQRCPGVDGGLPEDGLREELEPVVEIVVEGAGTDARLDGDGPGGGRGEPVAGDDPMAAASRT